MPKNDDHTKLNKTQISKICWFHLWKITDCSFSTREYSIGIAISQESNFVLFVKKLSPAPQKRRRNLNTFQVIRMWSTGETRVEISASWSTWVQHVSLNFSFLIPYLKTKDSAQIRFDPQVGKIPLEEDIATHSSILAWENPCREKPGGL